MRDVARYAVCGSGYRQLLRCLTYTCCRRHLASQALAVVLLAVGSAHAVLLCSEAGSQAATTDGITALDTARGVPNCTFVLRPLTPGKSVVTFNITSLGPPGASPDWLPRPT